MDKSEKNKSSGFKSDFGRGGRTGGAGVKEHCNGPQKYILNHKL